MCGFSGVISSSTIDISKLENSIRRISHRGPDASGTYISSDQTCALAHVRLSILDPSPSANQPMQIGSSVIVYNGEIYNHLKVREEVKGHFQTTSDTETILIAHQIKGNESLNMLSGMFAGAIFNEETKELILFRDSLGIKNVYYVMTETHFYFSSEIKSLIEFLDRTPLINEAAVKCYLKFENYPQGTSFFSGIKNLLPGQVKTIKLSKGIEVVDSAITPLKNSKVITGDLKTQAKAIIEEAVESHLLSDVPLGVYLSGGIDSSLVATIASRKIKDLQGFTGYFETDNQFYDERRYARMVAEAAGIHLHEVKITSEDFKTSFDQVVWGLDEPRMGMGAFSQFIVAREAAKQRKVILAGHGGDELFGGYPMFKAFWLYSHMGMNSKSLKFSKEVKSKEWIWIFYLLFKRIKEGKLYFAPEIFDNFNSSYDHAFSTTDKKNALEQLTKYYRDVYIPGLLIVEDKISMAHSLETRVPLWSNDLYQWANKLPPEIKLKNGELKHFLRDVAKDYLPAELFTAEKRGFPTPLRLWFRTELKDFVKDRLIVPNNLLDSLVPLKQREKIINSHISKALPFAFDERRAHQIWMLLCLESWQRQYLI
jgi:asparagine synthase (glutamine-hydrolysing)